MAGDWDYTQNARNEAEGLNKFVSNESIPYGMVVCSDGLPHPILGRDFVELGGVFVTSAEEAIGLLDTPYMNSKYNELKDSLSTPQRRSKLSLFSRKENLPEEISEEKILATIFNNLKTNIQYDLARVEREINPAKQKNYPLVPIEYFEKNKFGVCRHQTALAAYYVLKFVKDGYLKGNVSGDRNKDIIYDGTLGGHQWLRYKDKEGKVYILDVARGIFDTLDNIADMQANDPENSALWDYWRPEENKKVEKVKITNESNQIVDISSYINSNEEISIGRDSPSDIECIGEKSELISRNHAAIKFYRNGKVRIFDRGTFDKDTKKYNGTLNGTYVSNGEDDFIRIPSASSVLLKQYGRIIIGPIIITVDSKLGTLLIMNNKEITKKLTNQPL